jgi:hypothetical protein
MPRYLPQSQPSKDKCLLMVFYDESTQNMDRCFKIIKRLEQEFSLKLRKINLSLREDHADIVNALEIDKNDGQFPFFYNRLTGQFVSGHSSFENLKYWAAGDVRSTTDDDYAIDISPMREHDVMNTRQTGFLGFIEDRSRSLQRWQLSLWRSVESKSNKYINNLENKVERKNRIRSFFKRLF